MNGAKLPSVSKRLAPLSAEQHAEITRLIRSAMDTKAKNPTPYLTYQGRIVVCREVTRLARVTGVRRVKNHAITFSRALEELERRLSNGILVDERAARLAIEHLWRWLHGYEPIEPPPVSRGLQADGADWLESISGIPIIGTISDGPNGEPVVAFFDKNHTNKPDADEDEWPDVIAA